MSSEGSEQVSIMQRHTTAHVCHRVCICASSFFKIMMRHVRTMSDLNLVGLCSQTRLQHGG